MKVVTHGDNKKISRKELRFAALFMYSLLVSDKIFAETTLVIESVDRSKEQKRLGECGQIYITAWTDRFPRDFAITLYRDAPKKTQLTTLAHELVHMKQLTKNELKETYIQGNYSFAKWKGKPYNVTKNSYWDWPWEIEANGREYGLYKRYLDFVKAEQLTF